MIPLERVGEFTCAAIHEYTPLDVILYHLGIGARADELPFIYEQSDGGLKVCPTYAVVPLIDPLMRILPSFNVSLRDVLHGEQVIFLDREIPPEGILLTTASVPAVYDKGKAAVLVVETETTDRKGDLLFRTRASIFCRNMGRFGGDPGPRSAVLEIPEDRPCDFEMSRKTNGNQAVLYRLSGDLNPLHVDPAAASFAGFPRPILHGLCTFGFVGLSILRGLCRDDASRLEEFGVRFHAPVYPGDTITMRSWDMGGGLHHLVVNTERGEVFSNAYARIREG